MSAERVESFVKTRSCPSAEALLALQLDQASAQLAQKLTSHLAVCDFCAAESHFLSKHQPASLHYDLPTEMPPHLRLLAVSLFRDIDYGLL
jgi:hypothetical protein